MRGRLLNPLKQGFALFALALSLPPCSYAQEMLQIAEAPRFDGPRGEIGGALTLFRWSNQSDDGEAEEGPGEIVTDRPDFTEASSTVGASRFQIEAGYTFFRDRSEGETFRAHSIPETLLRIGLFADWFEFRIAQTYLNERVGTEEGPLFARGLPDLYLGAKIGLTEQSGVLPEMAIMPQMLVPTGDNEFNNKQVLAGVNWLYGWDVTDCISLGGSTQGNRDYDGVDYFMVFAQSATVNYVLTEQLGMFTEWFAFFPQGAIQSGISPEHYFDAGFTYKLTINLQLDIRAGVGLNESADDFFTGAGFAYRMGKNTRPTNGFQRGPQVFR